MGQSPSSTPSDNFGSSFDEFLKNFKIENKIFSEDDTILIKTYLENGNILKVISIIRDAMQGIEKAPLSIAMAGERGVGKSSFINALMGVGPEEKHAAKTGPVEMTMKRTPYKSLKFSNVTLWDLPGIGSTNFQSNNYLQEMQFGEYDFFIIISDSCFKETDAQLAKAIRKMSKNFYFVRTKVDTDLQNEKMCKPKSFNKETILQEIRDNYKKKLQEAEVREPQIFLVSNIDVSDYDFSKLETTLLHELPAHRCHMFMLSVSSVTEAIIDQKRDSLKQKLWLETLTSLKFLANPFMIFISDNDVKKLEEILTLYRSYFGLDDVSLKNIAKNLHVSLKQLKACIESPSLLSVENEDESLTIKLSKCVEKVCSANGTLFENALPFRKVYYLHTYFIDTVAGDAKALLKNVELFMKKVTTVLV